MANYSVTAGGDEDRVSRYRCIALIIGKKSEDGVGAR